MNIAKELAAQGKKQGICGLFYDKLKNQSLTKAQMCEMYLGGIDFCLANNFPNNDFIRAHFKGVMESHGIFLDETLNVENGRICVCLGACNGNFITNGFGVTRIYAKHDSKITIIAKDKAFVMVDVFDNSDITIYAHNRANVCVNQHGGTIHPTSVDNSTIKIREKNKKTY